eukprot:712698-Rhodomonas_salina.1
MSCVGCGRTGSGDSAVICTPRESPHAMLDRECDEVHVVCSLESVHVPKAFMRWRVQCVMTSMCCAL